MKIGKVDRDMAEMKDLTIDPVALVIQIEVVEEEEDLSKEIMMNLKHLEEETIEVVMREAATIEEVKTEEATSEEVAMIEVVKIEEAMSEEVAMIEAAMIEEVKTEEATSEEVAMIEVA
jgi:hypothetical protein